MAKGLYFRCDCERCSKLKELRDDIRKDAMFWLFECMSPGCESDLLIGLSKLPEPDDENGRWVCPMCGNSSAVSKCFPFTPNRFLELNTPVLESIRKEVDKILDVRRAMVEAASLLDGLEELDIPYDKMISNNSIEDVIEDEYELEARMRDWDENVLGVPEQERTPTGENE